MMLYRLLTRLDRNKFEPEVVALLSLPGPIKAKIEAAGIPVQIIGFKSKSDLCSIIRLYKLLKARQPHILHTQLFAADIIGRILGRLLGIPVIISSIRNEYYGGWPRDMLIKWTERFAMRTTVVSEAAAKRFIKDRVIPARKLAVIYNGIEPAMFSAAMSKEDKNRLRKELNLPVDTFLLLAVGSLTTQKGYLDLLRAIASMQGLPTAFNLVIAGSGPLENLLKSLAAELDLLGKVQFIGHSDDVPRLMAAADALVLTSLWEGLPGVVMEAMASELPVVATAVGGTPELMVDEITGFLVAPNKPEKISEALKRLILLPESERKAMGREGRRRVQAKFYLDKMVQAFEKIYIDCLREGIN